jgi:glucose-6-phosphate 1-epimerase
VAVATANEMIKVYEYTRQPPYWVVRDDNGFWLVPARANGWAERTPFIGRTAGLREVMPEGIELGITGSDDA